MKQGQHSGTCVRLAKWGVFAGLFLTAATAFSDIRFIGGDGADLAEPANWEGGQCPGASDVAVIPVGAAEKFLKLSQPLAVGGILLTDNQNPLTIESTGAALTIGAGGLTVEAGHASNAEGLSLKLPIVIAAEQTWDLGVRRLATYGTISGSATLTIGNSYGVDHYAAPNYGGKILYSMTVMADWTTVPVLLHAKGMWAGEIAAPDRDSTHMHNFGLAPAADETWRLGDVFAADSVYRSINDDVGFRIVADAGTVVHAADDDALAPQGGYRMETVVGTFEVAGGTFNAWNYFRLLNGSTVRVSGGTFNADASGKVCVAGGDGDDVQDPSDRRFEQVGGEMNAYGLAIGGDRSDWSAFVPFGEYVLGAGVLNAFQSLYGWNSLGGGLLLSAKMTEGGNVSAPGVFTQTGGVANVDFVRFGCDAAPSANGDGFGMLRLQGGTFNLGGDGFKTGTSWNPADAAAGEQNSAYRVSLSGGTFSPDAPALNVQADFPPSETAATVAPKQDMTWNGPIWGEGTLRKAGAAKLTLSDAGKFSGTLDVAEGEVVISPKAADPEAATCVRWTGDSARSYVNGEGQPVVVSDGEEVVEWHEANNGGQRKATRVTYAVTEDKYRPTGPTLVENAFGSHAGLSFSGNALEIPAADNPVAGQTEWSVVLVFKSTRIFWGAEWNLHSYMWRFQPGVLGNATEGYQQNDWGISLGSGSVYHLGVSYMDWDAPEGYDPDQPVAAEGVSLNDGNPHVLVCTQKGVVTTINADGALTSVVGPGKADAAYPRQNLPCYIGFNSSSTRDKVAGDGKSAQENFTDAAFQGVIAEVRLYSRALPTDEQNALIKALAMQYGAGAAGDDEQAGVAAPKPTIEFDADSLTGEDGDAITYWASTDGGKGVSQGAGGWGENAAPKLAKGTFAGHNAVRFTAAEKTALGLPNADIPWFGKKPFAVAVAFRTTTDGLNREPGDAWAEIKGRGILSTAGMNNNVNSLLLAFREKGAVSGGCLSTDAPWNWYANQLVYVRKPCYLNDGAVHVAAFTYDDDEKKLKLMVDGFFSQLTYEATQVQDSDQNLLIGSASPGRDLYFDGDIAAIQLFDRALSRDEMKAITDEWAARYGFLPATGRLFDTPKMSGGGIAARRINVDEGAKLTGSLVLAADSQITGKGNVAGTVEFGKGARIDFGRLPSISETYLTDGAVVVVTEDMLVGPADGSHVTKISGEITFDFTAVADRLPEGARLPLIAQVAPSVIAEGAVFRIVGLQGDDKSVFYDARNCRIMYKQKRGLALIIR